MGMTIWLTGPGRPEQTLHADWQARRLPEGDTTFQGRGEQAIMCNAGDGLLFGSEVWHRGTANRSDRTRCLLQVHYARRMITQKFLPYPHGCRFDEEILAPAHPRQRRLLGDHRKSNYD